MGRIWLSPPDVTPRDREMLLAALDSGWVSPAGPDLEAFESEIAKMCGRQYGIALSSGSAALHLGLLEAGVGRDDEVIVSTFTFAASANVVTYCGARPVFVDADADTWQMSPELLERAIVERRAAGARVAAVVIVDLYGQCADYDRILPVLDAHDVVLIEDAAEALGSSYRDRPAGSFGQSAAMSFNGNKIITSSGGGMLVTDDLVLAQRARYLATQAREPAPHYEHTEIGYNYRLSNLLAALGRGQLSDLDRRIKRREALYASYAAALDGIDGVEMMPIAGYGRPNYWLTCITIDPSITGVDRERVRLRLEDEDIESRPTWKPMHLQPVFRDAPAYVDGTSDRIFEHGLCLPSGSGMTDADQQRVIDLLVDTVRRDRG